MDREQARDYIKAQLEDYLIGKGLNTRKPFLCVNPGHNEKNPSMSYDRKRNKAHCFSCGADYDLLDLIGIEYGLTTAAEIFKKAHELYNLSIDGEAANMKHDAPKTQYTQYAQHTHNTQEVIRRKDFTEYIKTAHSRAGETDYFKQRGISQKTIARFSLGYDPAFGTNATEGTFETWQAVIIPAGIGSFTARNTSSTAEEKDRIRKQGSSILFNLKALESIEPVFLVEGEFDALSIIEAGAEAIALGSVANSAQFINAIKKQRPACKIILSLDNDSRGQQTAEAIQRELSALNIPFLQANISGEYKDPNEHLINNREGFIMAVMGAKQSAIEEATTEQLEYMDSSAANHISAFINGIAASVNTEAIRTGFNKLDAVLDGGLYEGFYVIGAISSLGKTTFVMQTADQITQTGQDVLIFSLEMARTELMAKSISRETLIHALQDRNTANAKTARGITVGARWANYSQAEKALIQTAIDAYTKYAGNLYISEGMGDIGVKEVRETIEKHKRITGKTPIVIIDYLQLLSPHDPRSSDKQNTDKAVLELKRISRDYKTPVIAISSFNRQGYAQAVTMESFKESGAIEYSSDVLIGLQIEGAGGKDFDVNEAKNKDPRKIELVILKNRSAATGGKIAFEYYPMFNYFREV